MIIEVDSLDLLSYGQLKGFDEFIAIHSFSFLKVFGHLFI